MEVIVGFDPHGFMRLSLIGNAFRLLIGVGLLIVTIGSPMFLQQLFAGCTFVALATVTAMKYYITRDEARFTNQNVIRTLYASMVYDLFLMAMMGCERLDFFSLLTCAGMQLFVCIKSKFVEFLQS